MKKIVYSCLIFSATFLLAYCTGAKKTSTGGSSNSPLLDAAQKRYPGISLSVLNEGKDVYTQKCGTCHALKDIQSESEKGWMHALESMAPKANLNETETAVLTKYILSARDAGLH